MVTSAPDIKKLELKLPRATGSTKTEAKITWLTSRQMPDKVLRFSLPKIIIAFHTILYHCLTILTTFKELSIVDKLTSPNPS